MGLELVSLIHGFVLGSGLWSIFELEMFFPLFQMGLNLPETDWYHYQGASTALYA